MAKIISIAVALTAILFMAYALPRPQEYTEAPPEEAATETPGETTTKSPCQQFDEQCAGQENGATTMSSNQTQGNTAPTTPKNDMRCEMLRQQCQNQTQTAPGGVTAPVTQPGVTQPTQPSQPTQPAVPDQNSTTPAMTTPPQFQSTPVSNQNITQPPAEVPNQNTTAPMGMTTPAFG